MTVREYPTGEDEVFEFGLTSKKSEDFFSSSWSDDQSDVEESGEISPGPGIRSPYSMRSGIFGWIIARGFASLRRGCKSMKISRTPCSCKSSRRIAPNRGVSDPNPGAIRAPFPGNVQSEPCTSPDSEGCQFRKMVVLGGGFQGREMGFWG